MTRQPRPVFVIKLQPVRSDSNSIHSLRRLLKILLRRLGFRCTAAYEEQTPAPKEDLQCLS
jgi:hypothetical protein